MNTSYKISDGLFLVNQELPSKNNLEPVKDAPTNHIAIIDCSGSMYGELPKIREQLKLKLPKILGPKDTFSIIWFSGKGQFGTLIEAELVAGLKDLATINKAIDRWLQPQGLTGFKEPIEEINNLVGRAKKKLGGNSVSVLFMSDGHDNQWKRADIIKAVQSVSGSADSFTFVEYGYYADRALLTSMSENAGGSLIFAQDFDSWEPTFESVIQKRTVGVPKVEMKVDGSPVRDFVWTSQDGEMTTFAVDGGKVKVPETVQSIWYVSSDSVGSVSSFSIDSKQKDGKPVDACYAAMSLFSVRMAPEVVLPILKVTGDVAFIERFGGLFGKQKYSEFMEEARIASYDSSKRLTKGFDPNKIPADDAFTVLDLLKLLSSDDENRVLLDHEQFKYSRISRGRVDSNSVLTDEEKEEVARLTDEMSKTKDVKKIAEYAAKISDISNKPEPLKFVANPAPEGYPISGLTYKEEMPNVSILVRKEGCVDVSKSKPSGSSIPDSFQTFIFRNYAIIKDGLVNVEVLPTRLSAKTLEKLFEENKAGRMNDEVVTSDGDVTYLNLKSLPVINRKMVSSVSAKTTLENEWSLLKIQASQKVYNSFLKEASGTKKSASFEDMYGKESSNWLKDAGFTDYSGFSPKSRQAESTDVYVAKELSVSLKGFSSIPSLNDFRKQIAKGKLTPSAQLMASAVKEVEAFASSPDGKDPVKFETWLKSNVKRLDSERRGMIANKAQQIFSIIVGQVWFKEWSSVDENTMDLEFDGQKISGKIEMSEVEVKI